MEVVQKLNSPTNNIKLYLRELGASVNRREEEIQRQRGIVETIRDNMRQLENQLAAEELVLLGLTNGFEEERTNYTTLISQFKNIKDNLLNLF